jgi:hypothetical protein
MADASGKLFGRKARVTLILPNGGSFSETDPTQNALVLEDNAATPGLRITFKITKTSGKEPNTGEVVVYNMAPTSRANGQRKPLILLLEVGYVSTGLARVFVGDVRTADPVLEDRTWKMTFRCGDGERAFRFAPAAESFAGPVQVGDVVRYCVKQMGLALGNSASQAAKLTTRLDHGWMVSGFASTELDRILRSVGYRYSIQDGEVQILLPGQSLAQTVPDLTPDTGLIGSPEMGTPDKKGQQPTLKYKALLMPQARPGGRNHVKCERYDGIFRTIKVVQEGDTQSGPWYSNFDGVADSSVRQA